MKALTAAGGLTNPHVLGLNAFNPLALDMQNGKAVTPCPDRRGGQVLAEPGRPLGGRAEADSRPEDVAGGVEALVEACAIGRMVIFAVLVFTMRGRWSPRAARRDLDEHERMVTEELARAAFRNGAGTARGRRSQDRGDANPRALHRRQVGGRYLRSPRPDLRPGSRRADGRVPLASEAEVDGAVEVATEAAAEWGAGLAQLEGRRPVPLP